MSIERARTYFTQYGITERILEFPVSSETVELAAQAVGCEGKQIAKTMSFLIGKKAILIVAAGDAKNQTTDEYIGKFDTTEEELKEELNLIQETLRQTILDEYDILIQLCDSLAGKISTP